MTNLPYPEINKNLCTGCYLCVDICPTNALAQINGKAALVRPELCTYCTVCEDICPEGAISLPFLVVFSQRKSETYPNSNNPEEGVNKT